VAKYRVMCIVTCETEGQARGLYNHIKAVAANPGNQPDDYASLHECTHDTPPMQPCKLINEWRPAA